MIRFVMAIAPCWLAAAAIAMPYRLPVDAPPTPPATPEERVTALRCASCHSLDYIRTQPPRRDEAFWSAEVRKMVTVYGASVSPDEAAQISRHLAR